MPSQRTSQLALLPCGLSQKLLLVTSKHLLSGMVPSQTQSRAPMRSYRAICWSCFLLLVPTLQRMLQDVVWLTGGWKVDTPPPLATVQQNGLYINRWLSLMEYHLVITRNKIFILAEIWATLKSIEVKFRPRRLHGWINLYLRHSWKGKITGIENRAVIVRI